MTEGNRVPLMIGNVPLRSLVAQPHQFFKRSVDWRAAAPPGFSIRRAMFLAIHQIGSDRIFDPFRHFSPGVNDWMLK